MLGTVTPFLSGKRKPFSLVFCMAVVPLLCPERQTRTSPSKKTRTYAAKETAVFHSFSVGFRENEKLDFLKRQARILRSL
jgi:hypothetical protein